MLVIDDAEENEFVSSIMIHNGTWVGYSRATEADSWANIYGTSTYQNFGGDYLEWNRLYSYIRKRVVFSW